MLRVPSSRQENALFADVERLRAYLTCNTMESIELCCSYADKLVESAIDAGIRAQLAKNLPSMQILADCLRKAYQDLHHADTNDPTLWRAAHCFTKLWRNLCVDVRAAQEFVRLNDIIGLTVAAFEECTAATSCDQTCQSMIRNIFQIWAQIVTRNEEDQKALWPLIFPRHCSYGVKSSDPFTQTAALTILDKTIAQPDLLIDLVQERSIVFFVFKNVLGREDQIARPAYEPALALFIQLCSSDSLPQVFTMMYELTEYHSTQHDDDCDPPNKSPSLLQLDFIRFLLQQHEAANKRVKGIARSASLLGATQIGLQLTPLSLRWFMSDLIPSLNEEHPSLKAQLQDICEQTSNLKDS